VCRYPTKTTEALLGWWNGTSFVHVPAHIINFSTVGCWVETSQVVDRVEKQSVWLCPLGFRTAVWTEGTVVSVKKRFLGKYQFRIKFLTTFPYDAFKALVYGPEYATETANRELPEHERDHYWR
jgi:hypothetical protein